MSTATAPKKSPLAPRNDAEKWNKPTSVAGLQELGSSILPQIRAALPHYMAKNSERMLRCLLTECQRTPALLDCSPRSLLGAVIQVAQLGLEIGGPAGQSYLIPFKGSATLVIGYKGFVTLAHRSGRVRRITPRIVREGDTFEIVYGTSQDLVHRPKIAADGKPLGYYAVVEIDNGGVDFEYMSVPQAEQHKSRFALSQKGPWSTDFDAMAMKTCIRKLAKRLPLSVEWVTAAGIDEAGETDAGQNLSAAVVLNGDGDDVSQLERRMEDAKKNVPPAVPPADPPGVGDPAND